MKRKFKKSDGQQFHQYQQNKQSPFILTPWTQSKTMTYDVGYTGFGLGQAQKCDCVKPVNGIPMPPLLITRFPMAIHK